MCWTRRKTASITTGMGRTEACKTFSRRRARAPLSPLRCRRPAIPKKPLAHVLRAPPSQVQSLAEEKQRAEAEAEQRASMLRVHQVQLVERAQERAAAAQALVTAAQEAAGWAEGDAKLRLTELLRQLEEHAAEAQLFAAQQEREVAVTQHSRGPAGGRALAGAADSDAALDDVAGVAPARRAGDADLEEELMEAMGAGQSFSERAKWIPLRLNLDERRLLRLLEASGAADANLNAQRMCGER